MTVIRSELDWTPSLRDTRHGVGELTLSDGRLRYVADDGHVTTTSVPIPREARHVRVRESNGVVTFEYSIRVAPYDFEWLRLGPSLRYGTPP